MILWIWLKHTTSNGKAYKDRTVYNTAMVSKTVLMVEQIVAEKSTKNVTELLHVNTEIYRLVTHYKNKITDHYKDKTWDKNKKLSNDYENIFTTPNTNNIALYTPVSRSFFKLWEILVDFKKELFGDVAPCRFLACCESPGGFCEAYMKYRSQYFNAVSKEDEYHGISLKSYNNRNVPMWKVNTVNIHYGKDDTGDIYNIENIYYLRNKLGENSIDFITGDGGFDFSNDFNSQEGSSLRLIICEVLIALLLQKEGGSFVLKVYDVFNEETMKVIHIVKMFYKKMYFIKPLTSRAANSEKYLLCIGYAKCESYEGIVTLLTNMVKSKRVNLDTIELDEHTTRAIVAYNLLYGFRQIHNIQKTIDYINHLTKDEYERISARHREKCISWCKKYDVPCINS